MGTLAVLSPWLSAMPRYAALGVSVAVAVFILRTIRAELRRGAGCLTLKSNGTAELDGEPLAEVAISWRGPVPCLRWRASSGACGAWIGTPDVLSCDARRLLRLASIGGQATPMRRSVAP